MPSLTYSYTLTLEGQRYGEGLQGGGAGPSRVYAEDSVYEGAASLVVWSPRGVKLDYTSSSVNLQKPTISSRCCCGVHNFRKRLVSDRLLAFEANPAVSDIV